MKKYGIILILLVAVTFSGLVAAHFVINELNDDVTVTETVLMGDRNAALGSKIAVEVQSTEHTLYWKVRSELTEGGLKTETAFSTGNIKGTVPPTKPVYAGKRLNLECDFPSGGSGASNGINLEYEAKDLNIPLEMAMAAAEATAAGESKTTRLYLKDYAKNVPVVLNYDSTMNRIYNSNGTYVDYSYFQIPAPDSLYYNIEIEKTPSGVVEMLGAFPLGNDLSYYVDSDGVIVGDVLYMAVSSLSAGKDAPEQIVSNIKSEQRGIHAIPLKKNGEIQYIDLDHAKTVFHLEEAERVIRMIYREKENEFHLYTEEDGKLWFSVIDKKTMERTKKFALMKKEHALLHVYYGENYSLILDGEGNFVLTSNYENLISGNMQTLDLMYFYVSLMETESLSFDYDGNRLAVAAVQLPSDEIRSSSCLLQIFDSSGLQYAGLYENSLEGDMLDRGMYTDLLAKPVEVRFVQ